ncbi:hypothetical protein [Planctobacterium marinum]|uniref:Uncharacterized protein n=1 Tax=Planctobacterium marinum TaxID=1631968 RepID=A0AA48KST4_9ALTE|nr:hypothetical protein MACH26_30080 [Planctobacterium marinum]
MSYYFEGHHYRAALPIASISINKCNVVFTDQARQQKLRFSNNLQSRRFVSWLVNLAQLEK